jgi:dienelactone hydrolase
VSSIRVRHLSVVFFAAIYLIGIIIAIMLNTNFGTINVQVISIPNGNQQINSILYRPLTATSSNPQPAVVVAHGLSGNKELMSGFALELARRDIVALTIDEIGHGNSDGAFRFSAEPTLGVLSAVRYLESQSYIRTSSIGLVGHSLGAGAVRATAVAHRNITASVLIGGGVGFLVENELVENEVYGTFNVTFPKNLLLAIGEHDVLFNLNQINNELMPFFNTSQPIIPSVQHGNFESQNARKLIVPKTIHLLEALDNIIISETVQWMVSALQPDNVNSVNLPETDLIYLFREGVLLVSLISFIMLLFCLSLILFDSSFFKTQVERDKPDYGFIEDWKILVIWGVLGLVLFFPAMLIGTIIPLPPLIFGTSITWWFFLTAILGLILAVFILPKFSNLKLNLKLAFIESLNKQGIIIAIVLLILTYVANNLMKMLTSIDLRVLTPLFGDLLPIPRIFFFLVLLPFLLFYFFVEGFYFHEFHKFGVDQSLKDEVLDALRLIVMRIIPYAIILAVQYIPMFLFNFRVMPELIGFFLEFLWGIVPLFIMSIVISWWFFRLTNTVSTGAVFNALLVAWILADAFPLGGLVIN